MSKKVFGKRKGAKGRRRVHGFMERMSTAAGRRVLKRRRMKQRLSLTIK